MSYLGYIDSIRGRAIRGWAYNTANPAERVRLRVTCNGADIGETVASAYRGDLESSGIGDGAHGFEFAIDATVPLNGAFVVHVAGSHFSLVDTTIRQRKRADEAFLHSHMDGLPALRHGFSAAGLGALDVEIAERMIAIWRGALLAGDASFVGSRNMWEIHAGDKQRDFVALLAAGDATALARYCLELPRAAITHGLFQGDEHSRTLAAASPEQLNAEAVRYWDHFVALGEALGVLNCECPEQGEWGRALFTPMDDLRARIEEVLGISVVPAQAFTGLFGLQFDDGILHRRDIHGCYAAYRLAQIAGGSVAPVVEIGGGMGGAAGYARRLGLRDYAIVDLPVISLLQYYFLAKSFGIDQVSFVERAADFAHDGRIHLIPAGLFGDATIGGFQLAFNMDSFPEMGAEVAGNYVREFARKKIGTIFSINQEATAPLTMDVKGERQACVREVARRTSYRQSLRYPNWVHKGYVDEVFALEGNP